MAEEITLVPTIASTITEQLDATQVPGASGADQRKIEYGAFGLSGSFSKDTTVKPRKLITLAVTLDPTPYVLDLTAAPLSVGRIEDLSGKRLHYFEFQTPGNSGGAALIACDITNGYPLFGDDAGTPYDFEMTANDKLARMIQSNDAQVIDATHKLIEFSGIAADLLNLKLVFGD